MTVKQGGQNAIEATERQRQAVELRIAAYQGLHT